MKTSYWIALVAGPLFLGWAHDHTDEIPIVLGLVLIVGLLLGALNPRMFLLSWAVTGAPLFVVETLVHFHVMGAPWPPSSGLPLAPLVAYVPALLGVSAGWGLRRMTGERAI